MLLRYLRGQAPDVAEDLAGDVWVAVARRLKGFLGDEAGFRSWLFTIARFRVIEDRRKKARRRTDPMSHEALDRPIPSTRGHGDPALLVLDRLRAQEAIELVASGLTRDQAEVVLLRVVAGFDVDEVAEITDRSPGSVRVLCHRALRRLAEQFGDMELLRDELDGQGALVE